MYALLRHKATHKVRTLLHKQRWSSTRQHIPFESFEVTIYAILDTRRKNGLQFSSKNCSSWISHLQKCGERVEKYRSLFCAIKTVVDIPPRLKTVGHVPRETSRNIFFFLKEENEKFESFVHTIQYQPSPILAGELEIPLKLTFKNHNFITHQKMKEFMTNLHSYDYDDKDNDGEIHFMIANEGLGSDKEEDIEVVKPKIKRKP